MSEGPRINRNQAAGVVVFLRSAWRMDERHCPAVGSFRRGLPDVGDVELLAPLPARGEDDGVYEHIARNCPRVANPGLFEGSPRRDDNDQFCQALRGLKPHFLEAALRVTLREAATGQDYSIPVQIYRYHRENRGWIEVLRTGPAGFGKAILARWRMVHGLPSDVKCSQDGYLQLGSGRPATTHSEDDVFRLADLPFIAPWQRDMVTRSIDQDEAFRRRWLSGARLVLPERVTA